MYSKRLSLQDSTSIGAVHVVSITSVSQAPSTFINNIDSVTTTFSHSHSTYSTSTSVMVSGTPKSSFADSISTDDVIAIASSIGSLVLIILEVIAAILGIIMCKKFCGDDNKSDNEAVKIVLSDEHVIVYKNKKAVD